MTGPTALDDTRFTDLVSRHRRELHVHCYRMLASFHEAEDAVQETYMRAWRHREKVEPDNLRAWLYRIATNVCLDLLRTRSRRLDRLESMADVPWLQPYPDHLLDELDGSPAEAVVERETIELAFITALQVLPPRQRAVLIARDVIGWSAAETAAHLETSVTAANSALQRARSTMRESLPADRPEWSAPEPTDDERRVLEAFIDAHERCDAQAALALASRDIRLAMPPDAMAFRGLDGLYPLLERAFGPDRDGEWRLVATAANRMPASATYLKRPGDDLYRAFKLDVLAVQNEAIVGITTFGASTFPALGLAPHL